MADDAGSLDDVHPARAATHTLIKAEVTASMRFDTLRV
jgi:hypothetical protein